MAFRKVYDSVVQEGRGKRTLTPHAERGSRHLSPRLEACRATPLTGSRRGTTCDSVLFDFKLMKGCETVRLDTVEPVQGAPTWRLSQPGPPARGARAGERWSPELTFSGRHNQRHLTARSPPNSPRHSAGRYIRLELHWEIYRRMRRALALSARSIDTAASAFDRSQGGHTMS